MEIHFHRPLFKTFAAGTDAPGSGVRSQPSHHVAQVHVAGEIGIGIEKKPRPAAVGPHGDASDLETARVVFGTVAARGAIGDRRATTAVGRHGPQR